ncbi:hypothetical protein [Geomesophilobacter sediminis]|uniref:Uncharacterized protein n=1 Tax=Geomesophilobacter sediminis TaxID=2798584 RepID=A0A8J7S8B8_9BACT|nr:hypothetical protein [Geomesophilobacter sediminis]MBJ6727571.1 hypothetical protein [Geomesophilobacter sediminis]
MNLSAIQCCVSASFGAVAREGEARLERHLVLLPAPARGRVVKEIEHFVRLLDETPGLPYWLLPPEAIAAWREEVATVGNEPALAAILLDLLLAALPSKAAQVVIPAGFVQPFLEQFQRILAALQDGPVGAMTLNNDLFLKDLAICRLQIFPGRAALIDRHSGIPRSLAFTGGGGQLWKLLRHAICHGGRFSPCFELHMHTPLLKEFHEAGWQSCYGLAAELLRNYPRHLAVIGSSWFYDPRVEAISPHLAYLRRHPLEGGAYFLRVGSSQADVDLATRHDFGGQRLKLYREGKFQPTKYMLVWPRAQLIGWSRGRPAPLS